MVDNFSTSTTINGVVVDVSPQQQFKDHYFQSREDGSFQDLFGSRLNEHYDISRHVHAATSNGVSNNNLSHDSGELNNNGSTHFWEDKYLNNNYELKFPPAVSKCNPSGIKSSNSCKSKDSGDISVNHVSSLLSSSSDLSSCGTLNVDKPSTIWNDRSYSPTPMSDFSSTSTGIMSKHNYSNRKPFHPNSARACDRNSSVIYKKGPTSKNDFEKVPQNVNKPRVNNTNPNGIVHSLSTFNFGGLPGASYMSDVSGISASSKSNRVLYNNPKREFGSHGSIDVITSRLSNLDLYQQKVKQFQRDLIDSSSSYDNHNMPCPSKPQPQLSVWPPVPPSSSTQQQQKLDDREHQVSSKGRPPPSRGSFRKRSDASSIELANVSRQNEMKKKGASFDGHSRSQQHVSHQSSGGGKVGNLIKKFRAAKNRNSASHAANHHHVMNGSATVLTSCLGSSTSPNITSDGHFEFKSGDHSRVPAIHHHTPYVQENIISASSSCSLGESTSTPSSSSSSTSIRGAKFTKKGRVSSFIHYDVNSVLFDVESACKAHEFVVRAANHTGELKRVATMTGASAASAALRLGPHNNSNATAPHVKDSQSGGVEDNPLVLTCPFFKNELGGESIPSVALSRHTKSKKICGGSHPNTSSSTTYSTNTPSFTCQSNLSIFDNDDSKYPTICPYRGDAVVYLNDSHQMDSSSKRSSTPATSTYVSSQIQYKDYGASFYRNHFIMQEHDNWLGCDANLGPVAISLKRQPLSNLTAHLKRERSEKNYLHLLSDGTGRDGEHYDDIVRLQQRHLASQENIVFPSDFRGSNVGLSRSGSYPEDNCSPSPSVVYSVIVRTAEMKTLRGHLIDHSGITVCGDDVSSSSSSSVHPHLPLSTTKLVLQNVCPELDHNCLHLATKSNECHQQLLRLDEAYIQNKYKVGLMYCAKGQKTEEEMYNNKVGSVEFEKFLDLIGQRVRLKGFDKYKAGLCNKNDSTGLHSVYTEYMSNEIMFHVSTLLPFATDPSSASSNSEVGPPPQQQQQVARKRYIGNDIVTIIFQDNNSSPFIPSVMKSQFQHIFIVVRVISQQSTSINMPPSRYKVAVCRSSSVPPFGPPIPHKGIFEGGPDFVHFLLTKIINGENATHLSDKFSGMAIRTRHQLLSDLAGGLGRGGGGGNGTGVGTSRFLTSVSLCEPASKFTFFGGKKKSLTNQNSYNGGGSNNTNNSSSNASVSPFLLRHPSTASSPSSLSSPPLPGAVSWRVILHDCFTETTRNVHLTLSSESIVLIGDGKMTQTHTTASDTSTPLHTPIIFHISTLAVIGWSVSNVRTTSILRIFFHQGECIILEVPYEENFTSPLLSASASVENKENTVVSEITQRLRCVSRGCGTQNFTIIKQDKSQHFGFHVRQDGLISQVERFGYAWQTGLRAGSRLVALNDVPLASISHTTLVKMLQQHPSPAPPQQQNTDETITGQSHLSTTSANIRTVLTVIPPFNDECNTPRLGCGVAYVSQFGTAPSAGHHHQRLIGVQMTGWNQCAYAFGSRVNLTDFDEDFDEGNGGNSNDYSSEEDENEEESPRTTVSHSSSTSSPATSSSSTSSNGNSTRERRYNVNAAVMSKRDGEGAATCDFRKTTSSNYEENGLPPPSSSCRDTINSSNVLTLLNSATSTTGNANGVTPKHISSNILSVKSDIPFQSAVDCRGNYFGGKDLQPFSCSSLSSSSSGYGTGSSSASSQRGGGGGSGRTPSILAPPPPVPARVPYKYHPNSQYHGRGQQGGHKSTISGSKCFSANVYQNPPMPKHLRGSKQDVECEDGKRRDAKVTYLTDMELGSVSHRTPSSSSTTPLSFETTSNNILNSVINTRDNNSCSPSCSASTHSSSGGCISSSSSSGAANYSLLPQLRKGVERSPHSRSMMLLPLPILSSPSNTSDPHGCGDVGTTSNGKLVRKTPRPASTEWSLLVEAASGVSATRKLCGGDESPLSVTADSENIKQLIGQVASLQTQLDSEFVSKKELTDQIEALKLENERLQRIKHVLN